MRFLLILGSCSLLTTGSELLRETQLLCYQTHNGITELAETFAKMRRGHEGEKSSSPSCNNRRILNYISRGDASWPGKGRNLGPGLALWEQLRCLQCGIWRDSSHLWDDYVFWHIVRHAPRSLSEGEGARQPPESTGAAGCFQHHTNGDSRRTPAPRTRVRQFGDGYHTLGADEATNGRLASLSLGQLYRTYASLKPITSVGRTIEASMTATQRHRTEF